MSTFCTPELQAKLEPAKKQIKLAEEKKAELKKQKGKDAAAIVNEKENSANAIGDNYNEYEILKSLGADASLLNDPGSNPSGLYNLVAGKVLFGDV